MHYKLKRKEKISKKKEQTNRQTINEDYLGNKKKKE